MTMNAETAKAALSLLERGEDFAWATIVDSRGSSPRHAGASMLVRADGSIAGTVGGGPLEAAAIRNALKVLETREPCLMDYDLTGADSAQLGMICGGHGLVLIDYVGSKDPAAQELFQGLFDLLDGGGKGWLVTVVSEKDNAATAVGRCLVDSDGSIKGDPVCPPDTLRGLAQRGGTYDRIVAGDPSKTYVQPVGTRGTAYVFGAGHCGEKLLPILNLVGFFTVVIDDRPDFADSDRFPTADRIVVPESFESAMELLPIDEDSYIVIVTRGHVHDKNVLRQALETPAGYIGMIGSKKKVAQIFEALAAERVTGDDLARVHSPIGLPIGAETPEEIAISIAAELIQVRANQGA
jgi:xanthine dehydrogenase accessory factor